MEYTVIVNNRSYDLPKKTIVVVEKLDSVLKIDSAKGYSIRQKFEKLHGFVKELVGDDNAREMFGSDRIEDIDLSEVTIVVRKIVDAYDKPIIDYDAEKSRMKLDGLPIEKIISVAKAADKIATFQPQK